MDATQAIQGEQYAFPYHYLPQLTDKGFRSFRAWGWSLNYVTALRLVSAHVKTFGPNSLIDVGCGDGALVHHLHKLAPKMRIVGVDYDQRPIEFARLFTPGAEFFSGDVADVEGQFDVATLVEVLEHIPMPEVPDFMRKVRSKLVPGGRLIVTVPHRNKPLEDKHYRHFTFDTLAAALVGFDVVEIFGFEQLGGWKKRVRKVFDNKHWFAEVGAINRLMLKSELAYRDKDEIACGRIFAICRARASAL